MTKMSIVFFFAIQIFRGFAYADGMESEAVFPRQTSLLNPIEIYDKTMSTVTAHFYDPTFRGLPWSDLVTQYRARVSVHSSSAQLKLVINDLLAQLHASHTEFLSWTDQEYWALQCIFSGDIDGYPVQQIGAWFTNIDQHWFVKNVFEGGPAERSGLKPGDEIVAVADHPLRPVESFIHSKEVEFKIRRFRGDEIHRIQVAVLNPSVQRSLLTASQLSYKVVKNGQHRIAYFHLWSGSHDLFKQELKRAAEHAQQESDALILDLRDGFGGADPSFLDPFFTTDSGNHEIPQIFSKPLIVLINDGVRSGKEWLAYILKERKRALLVGTRTKGYFLGGSPFQIDYNYYLLYLAVSSDPTMPPLENNGVQPDVEVKNNFPYSVGRDIVLTTARELASKFTTFVNFPSGYWSQ